MLHDAMITRPDLSPLLPTFENDGRPSPPPAYTQYTFVCVLSFEASHTDPVNCPPDGVKLTEIDVQGSAGLRLPRALSMTAKSALHFRRFHDTVPRDTTTHDVRDNDAGRQNARNVSPPLANRYNARLIFRRRGDFLCEWLATRAFFVVVVVLQRGGNVKGGFILDLFCWKGNSKI